MVNRQVIRFGSVTTIVVGTEPPSASCAAVAVINMALVSSGQNTPCVRVVDLPQFLFFAEFHFPAVVLGVFGTVDRREGHPAV
jgi:hypothetical protein